MYRKFVKTLHCPVCKDSLKVKKTYFENGSMIVRGLLVCSCNEYPIIDGILLLTKTNIKKAALRFVQKEKDNLRTLPEVPLFLLRLPLNPTILAPLLSVSTRINPFKKLSFLQFVRLLRLIGIINLEWSQYLLERTNRADFHSAAICTSLVKKNAMSLDAGCGSGHLLRLLNKEVRENKLFGVDFSIINLYLAKKYQNQTCNYIYLDLNKPLPFTSKQFRYTFLNDVFHYILGKKTLGKELTRISKDNGLIILNNLHNKYFSSEFIDPVHYPDTPGGYSKNFPNLAFSLFSEEKSERGLLEHVSRADMSSMHRKLKTFTLILSKDGKTLPTKNIAGWFNTK